MSEITTEILARELENWFNKYENNKIKINWNTDPVGKIIKSNLQKQKRWKNLPRGNPSKAYKITNKIEEKEPIIDF